MGLGSGPLGADGDRGADGHQHAHASQADVTVEYRSDELRIEVRDDGTGAAPNDGHGYGLVGIRERVKIYGGEMTTETAGDGFVLRARLPLRDVL